MEIAEIFEDSMIDRQNKHNQLSVAPIFEDSMIDRQNQPNQLSVDL